MKSHLKERFIFVRWMLTTLVAVFLFTPFFARALEEPGKELQELGVFTELGAAVDSSLSFQNSKGEKVQLADLQLPGKPLVVIPVYYRCPRLCGLALQGVTEMLRDLQLQLGQDFSIATVSFDHREGAELAAKRAAKYRQALKGTAHDPSSWYFLTGEEKAVAELMGQIGFRYREDNGEFAHSAAIMVLTPGFKISQYFGGIHFSSRDVRLALVDAGQGQIGGVIDQVLLFCFRFDSTQGQYTYAVFNLLQIAGGFSFLFLAFLIVLLRRRENLGEQGKDST